MLANSSIGWAAMTIMKKLLQPGGRQKKNGKNSSVKNWIPSRRSF